MRAGPSPPRIGSLVLPVLNPREAETIIDLLGQIQAALWDEYGEAILARLPDEVSSDEDAAATLPLDDDLPF